VDAEGTLQESVLGTENSLSNFLRGGAGQTADGIPASLDSTILISGANLAKKYVELGRTSGLELIVLAGRLPSTAAQTKSRNTQIRKVLSSSTT